MELTTFWTNTAKRRLINIFDYYKDEAGVSIAQNLVDEIVAKTIRLKSHPLSGQVEPILESMLQDFRYITHKNYKIIYYLNETKSRIEIVNVFDCRQNPEKIFIF